MLLQYQFKTPQQEYEIELSNNCATIVSKKSIKHLDSFTQPLTILSVIKDILISELSEEEQELIYKGEKEFQ